MGKKIIKEKKRATLRDVAERAGVSVMTVSNVVNEKFEFVSSDTAKKVQNAIAELEYVPSATSRKLRSRQELSIALVIMDDEPDFLVNPFISHLAAGLSNHLSENNFSLTVQGVLPGRLEESSIFSIVGSDAICAILCGSESERRRYIKFLLGRHQPIVVFQETLTPRNSNFASIRQDDREGGYCVASHLLSRGARKLLFVRPLMEWVAIEERLKGVMSAVAEQKASSCTILNCNESGFAEVQSSVARAFAESGIPDAIVGGTDALGIAALRYCQDQGYVVPDDIMVTGFNGFDVCNYTNPPITTVVSPAYDMGKLAGALVLDRLRTGRFSKKRTLFPVCFRAGGST